MSASVAAELAKAFRPAKFEFSKLHFCGGLLKKPMPLTTKKVTDGKGHKIFVKMLASEPWLIGAVTGQQAHGLLCRTTLLTTFHDYAEKACNGELDTRAVEEDPAEYDPMQEIDVEETHSRSRGEGTPASTAKRCRYYKNQTQNRLLTVNAPAISFEEDPLSTCTRTIHLYVVDRKQVWLDIDDMEWALRFLCMQYTLKGVPVVSPNDTGPGLVTPQKRKANDPW